MFGADRAIPAIAKSRRALIVRDCVEALTLHQTGREETVAVVQSPITRAHLTRLAAAIGVEGVHLSRQDGHLGVVAAPPGDWVDDQAFASRSVPNGFALIHSNRKAKQPQAARQGGPAATDADLEPRRPTRAIIFLAGGLLGAGLPLGLLLLATPMTAPAARRRP